MDIIVSILLSAPGALITVGFHEFVKAAVSSKLGDPTPKREGRLTLNPFSHVDPLGLLFMVFLGYGWGRPVNTSPVFYANRKRDTVITHALPVVANVLLSAAFLCAGFLIFQTVPESGGGIAGDAAYHASRALISCARFNIAYAVLNIAPVYPFAGAKILSAALRPQAAVKLLQYEKVLQMLLIVLILTRAVDFVIGPVADAFLGFMLNLL